MEVNLNYAAPDGAWLTLLAPCTFPISVMRGFVRLARNMLPIRSNYG
jgi:hypothetical protein